jgi:4-hydroxy-tetrahydrodipicolinate reductase
MFWQSGISSWLESLNWFCKPWYLGYGYFCLSHLEGDAGMSKIGLIGPGRMGQEVVKLLSQDESVVIFNKTDPLRLELLQQLDVVIVFIPGDAVPSIFDVVLASGVPSVWGSTGFTWPQNLDQQLKQSGSRWVVANNFSPMMILIEKILKEINAHNFLLDDATFHIHETHHIHKKDQPSGTALSWQKWLDLPCTISSKREGEKLGFHELTVGSEGETLTIHHEAKDRSIFARGALYSARYLMRHPQLSPGLYAFNQLISHEQGGPQ